MRSNSVGMVLCLAFAAGAGAEIVQLPPSRDNTLYEDSGGSLSNGSGESFFAGRTLIETLRRGLIAFDLSVVPAGSTVTSVTLTLECTRSASLAEPVSLRLVLAGWGEGASIAFGEGGNGAAAEAGDATWLFRYFPGDSWASPGGDFGATSATTPVAGIGSYTWSSPAMLQDVQSWVDSPATNFGWGVFGNEDAPQSAKRFASRENVDQALRPRLDVEYTPIPAPAGLGAALGWITLRVAVGRRRIVENPATPGRQPR